MAREIHRLPREDGTVRIYEEHEDGTVTRRVERIDARVPEQAFDTQAAALQAAEGFTDLRKLTVPELRAYAAAHGIDLGKARLKPDIIRAISLIPADPVEDPNAEQVIDPALLEESVRQDLQPDAYAGVGVQEPAVVELADGSTIGGEEIGTLPESAAAAPEASDEIDWTATAGDDGGPVAGDGART